MKKDKITKWLDRSVYILAFICAISCFIEGKPTLAVTWIITAWVMHMSSRFDALKSSYERHISERHDTEATDERPETDA